MFFQGDDTKQESASIVEIDDSNEEVKKWKAHCVGHNETFAIVRN